MLAEGCRTRQEGRCPCQEGRREGSGHHPQREGREAKGLNTEEGCRQEGRTCKEGVRRRQALRQEGRRQVCAQEDLREGRQAQGCQEGRCTQVQEGCCTKEDRLSTKQLSVALCVSMWLTHCHPAAGITGVGVVMSELTSVLAVCGRV